MLLFSKDLGIDLGTSNVLIYAAGKGIVLREPSVVALDKNTGKILQVGAAARNMLGRTPGNVAAIHPLQDGVISDYELTARMLTEMIRRVVRFSIVKPRMIVCVPSGITEVEERAVIQAAMEAGARRVYLIEEPLAAALGAHLDVSAKYVRKRFGVIIGANTAEEIKLSIGCVSPRPASLTMTAKGRDVKSGLAHEFTVTSEEIMEVLRRPARQIADRVLDVLEQTTPELVADISKNGILLTGGGSQLWGMDQVLRDRTEMNCVVADDADSCVAYGCGKSLGWMNHMQEGTINISRRRLLKE